MIVLFEQKLKDIKIDELKNIMHSREKGYLIIDAREVEDYCKGHIPGAIDAWANAGHRVDTCDQGSVKAASRPLKKM